MSSSFVPASISGPTTELVSLLLRSKNAPASTVERALRLLRPAQGGQVDHAVAVKLRLCQSILASSAAEGPTLLSSFEQQCDSLRRLNSSLLHPILALLEPLSFPKKPVSFFSAGASPSSSSSSRTADRGELDRVNAVVPGMFDHQFDGSLPARRGGSSSSSSSSSSSGSSSSGNVGNRSLNNCADDAAELQVGEWISPEIEALLLQDLIFVFQGIAGRHIRYDPRSEQYVVDPALQLRDPARDTVLCLCELGWLYGKVHAYMQRAERETRGLVVQAFGFALQQELLDYFRLLSILESEASRGSEGRDTEREASGLTLLRLRAWMQEPLERLFLMARLVEGAGPLIGGALASRLHGHTRHGDDGVRTLVSRIMKATAAPLYGMLERWVLHGELHDSQQEFFIGASTGISAHNTWQEGYFLRTNMLPTYLPLALAQRVLVIGKSINFMRLCQGRLGKDQDSSSSSSPAARDGRPGRQHTSPASTPADVAAGAGEGLAAVMQYGSESQLAEAVTKIAVEADARLLQMIENKFSLHAHLLALKQFLLLGQGDFVICLMDVIGPELKKRANQLYRHNLTEMLEGALRASNAHYLPISVLDRVGVRLLEASPGDTGWEVFSLDYSVDPPLNAIVHAHALSQYRTAFHMLWRLKRVEWTLGAAWRQLLAFSHTRGGGGLLPRLRPVLHRCTLNRARMLHVITTLSAFLMFEVLESAWQSLQETLTRSKCLDDVIRAHDAYLEGILQRALLTSAHENLNLQLQSMLQAILRFCALEDALLAEALASLARRKAREAEAEAQTKAGTWGSTGREDPSLLDPPGSIDGVPGYVITRLDEAAKDYSQQFDALMAMLRDQGEKAGDISRFLALRLDFNGYHAMQKELGRSGVVTSSPPVRAR